MTESADLREYAPMFRLDPSGFEAIQQSAPHKQVTTLTCKNGEAVVCVEGRKLHSGRDPKLEAKRFARSQSVDEIDILIILGYASGYLAQEMAIRSSARIVVFEPSLEILKEGLPHCPANEKIQVITSMAALKSHFEKQFKSICNVKIIAWPASARLFGNIFEAAQSMLTELVKRSKLEHNTHHFRSQGWLNNYLTNLPALAKHPNITQYQGAFSNNPAIICSAGPSLNKNAELLKSLQGKCLIIAVNTAARALASMGIQAHVIVSVESLDITSQLEDIDWLGQATAFLELTGNPRVFSMGFKSIVPLSVSSSSVAFFSERLQPGQTFAAGQCVANAAVAIAGRLGCPGIVLIGQDLAYEDDVMYAKGTVFEEIRVSVKDGTTTLHNMEAKDRIENDSDGVFQGGAKAKHNYRPATLPAWGRPEDRVQSNEAFANFSDWFSKASDELKKEGKWVVNATEGGAHIAGWDHIPLHEAIEKFQLAEAPSTPGDDVVTKLETLANKEPLPAERMRSAIQAEREKAIGVVKAALVSRGWVNSDPDGDVFAGDDVSTRINEAYLELRDLIATCPLLQAQVGQPLQATINRQELNTFTISKLIEDGAAKLDERLDAIVKSLDAHAAQSRAAS